MARPASTARACRPPTWRWRAWSINLDALPVVTRQKITQRAQIREAISHALSDQLFPGA